MATPIVSRINALVAVPFGLLGDGLVHLDPESLRYAFTAMVGVTSWAALNFLLEIKIMRSERAASNEEVKA